MIKNNLKFGLLILGMMTILSATELVQTASPDSTWPLQPGLRALQFQITDFWRLSAFEGAAISCKRHRSAVAATRLGISIGGTWEDLSGDMTKSYWNDDTLTREDAADDTRTFRELKLGFSLEWLKYTATKTHILLFWGFGPRLQVTIREGERIQENQTKQVQKEEYTEKYRFLEHKYMLGIKGLVGVEWFFNPQTSLHAENATSLMAGKDNLRQSNRWFDETKKTVKDFTLNGPVLSISSQVKFGLSVYF